jgi:hypothetical protein
MKPLGATIFLPMSRRLRKSKRGGQLRREERYLSRRVRVCVDRVGAVDHLSEGVVRLPFPRAPARPESHMSRGQVGPTRTAHIDEFG